MVCRRPEDTTQQLCNRLQFKLQLRYVTQQQNIRKIILRRVPLQSFWERNSVNNPGWRFVMTNYVMYEFLSVIMWQKLWSKTKNFSKIYHSEKPTICRSSHWWVKLTHSTLMAWKLGCISNQRVYISTKVESRHTSSQLILEPPSYSLIVVI